MTPWQLAIQAVREHRDAAAQAVDDLRLRIDVTRAAVEIYRCHGKKHPCEMGAGDSVETLERQLTERKAEAQQWETALRLVEDAAGDAVLFIPSGVTTR